MYGPGNESAFLIGDFDMNEVVFIGQFYQKYVLALGTPHLVARFV